nr:intraflagellar transport protein 20 homolog isoform X4 [Macaca nemestrina]
MTHLHLLLTATVTPSEQNSSRKSGWETAMAKDILGEAGLHFDELNKLRVLDPEVTQQTIELKEECKDFVDSHRCSELAQIYSKAERSSTAATSSTNSRKENAARKVRSHDVKQVLYTAEFPLFLLE